MKKTLAFLLLVVASLGSQSYAAEILLSNEIRSLLNPCGELLTKNGVIVSQLNSSETSAEYVRQQLTRPEVLSRFVKAPLEGVGVHIIDSQGRVLMAKRKGSHGAGQWAIPGGHIEAGEAIFDAAVREIREEIGIELEDLKFVGVTFDHFPKSGKSYFDYHLTARIKSGTPKIMEPDKVDSDWTWFDPKNLPSPLFTSLETLRDLGFMKALPEKTSPKAATKSSAKGQNPQAVFRSEYKDWTKIDGRNLSYLEKDDLKGFPVAVYYTDSKSLNEPVILEGYLKKVTSKTVPGFDDSTTYYSYHFETKSGETRTVAKEDIKEMRLGLPAETGLESFRAEYDGFPKLSSSELRWLSDKNTEGQKVAVLVKIFGQEIALVGTVEKIKSQTRTSYDDSSETYVYYTIRTDDGQVGTYLAESIIEMRVFGRTDGNGGLRIIK